ncbi:MAG: hypothetical protein KatS3mg105_1234 [Gemmatales bacterium]|nr:MAG: hypothetical protein KatS3mg105_1234 [Gemmatales bacterium]
MKQNRVDSPAKANLAVDGDNGNLFSKTAAQVFIFFNVDLVELETIAVFLFQQELPGVVAQATAWTGEKLNMDWTRCWSPQPTNDRVKPPQAHPTNILYGMQTGWNHVPRAPKNGCRLSLKPL